MKRAITTLAVAVLALGWTTACEPPPPPASFTVNVTPSATGDDANPGDGICETAPGNGECTLDAAVQEGNALGRADIHLPEIVGRYDPFVLTETTITGHLAFISVQNLEMRANEVRSADLQIAAGGRLSLAQTAFSAPGTTTVEGVLYAHRSIFAGRLEVGAGALLSLVNSAGGVLASDLPAPTGEAWITNRGMVVVRFGQLYRGGTGWSTAASFNTLDDGVTTLGATLLVRYGLTSPDCLGTAPVSEGYNNALGCGLAGPGDVTDGTVNRPMHDIPPGVAGCGTTVTVDWFGRTRPAPYAWPSGQCSRGLWE